MSRRACPRFWVATRPRCSPGSKQLDLVAANRNAAGQIVAAGRLSALDKLAEDPPAKARVRALGVAGAFHTEFMASALDGYAAAVQNVDDRGADRRSVIQP